MLSFYQSGESSEDGTVVVLSESLANGRKNITAEIIAGTADSIFVKKNFYQGALRQDGGFPPQKIKIVLIFLFFCFGPGPP